MPYTYHTATATVRVRRPKQKDPTSSGLSFSDKRLQEKKRSDTTSSTSPVDLDQLPSLPASGTASPSSLASPSLVASQPSSGSSKLSRSSFELRTPASLEPYLEAETSDDETPLERQKTNDRLELSSEKPTVLEPCVNTSVTQKDSSNVSPQGSRDTMRIPHATLAEVNSESPNTLTRTYCSPFRTSYAEPLGSGGQPYQYQNHLPEEQSTGLAQTGATHCVDPPSESHMTESNVLQSYLAHVHYDHGLLQNTYMDSRLTREIEMTRHQNPVFRNGLNWNNNSARAEAAQPEQGIPGQGNIMAAGPTLEDEVSPLLHRIQNTLPDINLLVQLYRQTRYNLSICEDRLRQSNSHDGKALNQKDRIIELLSERLEAASRMYCTEKSSLELQLTHMEQQYHECQERLKLLERARDELIEVKSGLEKENEQLLGRHNEKNQASVNTSTQGRANRLEYSEKHQEAMDAAIE
ncbi:hypothetical protein MMC09_004474 [Bachmanniomyces sp. S44760]|nr:hypothetical protein [Bachmanniomyces sp. S44760]